MLSRICFAVQEIWRHRAEMKEYLHNPKLQIPSVLDLKEEVLQQGGIKALILDYDGVLASHGEPEPTDAVMKWLEQFTHWPVYILSNKPTLERRQFFEKNFSKVKFIKASRKKPYPDGINEIIRLSNLQANELILLDDRLTTGILAAIIAGIQAKWVTHPYVNLSKRPFQESWFIFLRWCDRIICKI